MSERGKISRRDLLTGLFPRRGDKATPADVPPVPPVSSRVPEPPAPSFDWRSAYLKDARSAPAEVVSRFESMPLVAEDRAKAADGA